MDDIFGGAPSAKKIETPPPPEAAEDDPEELARLARERKEREKKRTGRSKLVINNPTGLSLGGTTSSNNKSNTGLSIL